MDKIAIFYNESTDVPPCIWRFTPPKTHMTIGKKQPFEDVCPIKNGDFPLPW